MSTNILNPEVVSGTEALTVGERLVSFFKELSVGVDAFNAKNFNKSIHTVKGSEVWKELAAGNDYFSVSIKHIPSPVFFNPTKLSFKSYVDLILRAVPIIKLVDSQAELTYRGFKTAVATGKVPFSIRNHNDQALIRETRDLFKSLMTDTQTYTRSVGELYPNFTEAFEVCEHFNRVVGLLQSRDVEVVAKRVDQVVYLVNMLKGKLDSNEIILQGPASETLNQAINELSDNVNFAGMMISQLSVLTRVLQLQIDEARKLK